MKFFGLHKRILALARIEHEHDFMRRRLVAPRDHALDLGEFVHEPLLVLQPAGRVGEEYVDVPCPGCFPGVEDDSRRIRASLL